MKPKLLIFTDSLGLPREKPEIVEYNQTWVNLLKANFEILVFSFGGGTVDQMYSQIAYLKMFNPDFVIVQSGIVDCAPRALKQYELEIIKRSRLLSKIFGNKRVVSFLRKKRKVSYTSKIEFLKYLKQFKNVFGEKLFWIGIMPASDDYEKTLPGIKNKVKEYNEILKNNLGNNFIDTSDFDDSFLMIDNIHLNIFGNMKLSKKITLIIKQDSLML